ncbi:MAG: BolA/IbaG family iron-sulfur metabolism protein [Candidatus Omnitrophica bacterium]|nr:BolA/IbaG family iron-sulfur metabolism protein [Candidatus Omnitrophota bacterium]
MKSEDVHKILSHAFESAEITVQDLTGGMDHFSVIVMWDGFKGKSLIQQHQMVNQSLKETLEDGRIHALQIKTVAR